MKSKQFKATKIFQNKGAGDVIAEIAKKSGIEAVVKGMFGNDCGCPERAKKLNQLWPNAANKKISPDQAAAIITILSKMVDPKVSLSRSDTVEFFGLYNIIYNTNRQVSNCGSCVKSMSQHLVATLTANSYERNLGKAEAEPKPEKKNVADKTGDE